MCDEILHSVATRLEHDSLEAMIWFENYYMKLNTEKCRLSISGSKSEHIWTKIGDNKILERNKVKVPGITIDNNIVAHIIKNNKFINSSIQKGCMEKVPGCWEHMSMVWSALNEARTKKSNVATIWLDIANAYGSIPHRLIFFALRRYGVPENWILIITNYYIRIWCKSFSDKAPSNWHQHLRGIFAGCTVSIVLFLAGMNVIIEYTQQCNVPNFISSSKVALPLIRAFMDDINLMSQSVSGAQSLLSRCSTALMWAEYVMQS